VWCAHNGESREDYADSQTFEQLSDDEVMSIWHEDDDPRECGCAELQKRDTAERNKPFDDWCALKKLVESMGGRCDVRMPARADTGRHFGPNGHEKNCPKGKIVKTCAEWARDNGRGFLCSTEY
jgi:hypothetical protein